MQSIQSEKNNSSLYLFKQLLHHILNASLLLCLAMIPLTVSGYATQWTGNNSTDWNDGGNWASGVPTSATLTTVDLIGSTTSAPYTATIQTGTTAQAQNFYIGRNSGNNGTLNISGGSLSTTFTTFIGGDNGSVGLVNISGGTIASNNIVIASNDGSTGTLNFTGGSIVSNNITNIGQGGSGTLNLTGGTYTSNNIIVVGGNISGNGTLNIGADALSAASTAGTITGSIQFEQGTGTINFNHTSSNYNFSNNLFDSSVPNGASAVNIRAGKTIFTGTKTYSPATNVIGGELVVGTAITNSAVTVNSGGTLSGTGSVHSLTLDNGSVYKVDLASATTSYLTANTGVVDISNASLLINVSAGTYSPGTVYTLLTAPGGRTGQFVSVSTTGSTLLYDLSYNPTNIQLTVRSASLSSLVAVGNPGVVAIYLDQNAPDGLKTELNSLAKPQLQEALNQLSPAQETQRSNFVGNTELNSMATPFTWAGMDRLVEQSGQVMANLVHQVSSLKQSFVQLFGNKHRVRTVAHAIARDPDPKHLPVSARVNMGKINLWIQGGAGRFSQNNVADPSGLAVQGLDGSTYGTSIGLDYALSNTFKLGVTTGYGLSKYKMKGIGARGNVDSARFSLYGLWQAQAWYLNGAASYGHHRFKANRIMTVIPAIAHHKHDGHHVSGLAEVGKDISLTRRSLVMTPYVSVGALFMRENGYTEQGAGVQNVAVKSRNSTAVQGKGGVQLANLWYWHDETSVYSFARLGITYRRALGSYQKVSANLVGQGGVFTVRTRNKNRVLANPNIGLTVTPFKGISATLAYEGDIGSNQRNHQALVRVDWML